MSIAPDDELAAPPRRFKPYSAYRDSGVEWLRKIPAHWEVKRLKHLAALNPEVLTEDTDRTMEMLYVDIGSVNNLGHIIERQQMTFGAAPSRARRLVRDGDVIVSTVRTYLRAIAPMREPEFGTVVSTGFAVIRPEDGLTSDYAAYALRAPYFVERVVANSKGVSFPAISESEMSTYEIAVPPVSEQHAIAALLDRETARIDDLVAKKNRLIQLLQEQRTAVITRAVTKGLDPNASMKVSGVEWLGEIPAHWEVKRLKHLAALNPDVLSEDTDPTMEMFYVDIGSVNSLGHITEREQMTFGAAPSRARRCVQDGDVIISTVRTYLRAIAPICQPEPDTVVSTGFAVVRPDDGLTTSYAAYALRAPYFVERVVASSRGVSFPAISEGEMATYEIAVPPETEQRAIAAFLDLQTARIDALIAKMREAIERLTKLRTALISAAVVGKMDVREEIA